MHTLKISFYLWFPKLDQEDIPGRNDCWAGKEEHLCFTSFLLDSPVRNEKLVQRNQNPPGNLEPLQEKLEGVRNGYEVEKTNLIKRKIGIVPVGEN